MIAGQEHHDKRRDRAHQHHPFNAQIEHAGLFHHQLAKRGNQDRRGCTHNSDDDGDDQLVGHACASLAGATRLMR